MEKYYQRIRVKFKRRKTKWGWESNSLILRIDLILIYYHTPQMI